MKSLLIRDTTKEARERIVRQALWGSCGKRVSGGWDIIYIIRLTGSAAYDIISTALA